jgi:hypothetical protein
MLAGSVSVGQTLIAPTAFLDVAASIAGSASLRVRAGVSVTTPNEGDIINSSTQKAFQFFSAGVIQTVNTCLFTQTANKNVSATTTETSLIGTGVGTLTLPANFWVVGKALRIKIRGFFSRTNGNVTFRFKLGAVTIVASATASSGVGANDCFEVTVDCTCRTTGATGAFFAQGNYFNFNNGNNLQMVSVATVASDTTVSSAVDTTIEFSVSNAGNTFTSTNTTLEVLN